MGAQGALVGNRGIQAIARSSTARSVLTTNIVLFTNWLWLHEACHDRTVAYLHQGWGTSSQPPRHAILSQLPPISTMDANSQRPKGRDSALSSLNVAIDAMNLAKDIVDIAPAKAAFGSVGALLTMIRVRFFLLCNELRVHMFPGLDGKRTGLRRSRVELR
jgi:hypothetical protein